MRMSERGVALLAELEGERLEAYRDSVGIWTIGVGHTAAMGEPIPVKGMRITPEKSRQVLREDLADTEKGVLKYLKKPVNQNQFDAMVCFAFNVGVQGFAKSSVCRHFNASRFQAAGDAFLLWNKAGGVVSLGLSRRRRREKELFLKKSTA